MSGHGIGREPKNYCHRADGRGDSGPPSVERRLPPKPFFTSARFMMSGTPTCREDKRCCMADVATDVADIGDKVQHPVQPLTF